MKVDLSKKDSQLAQQIAELRYEELITQLAAELEAAGLKLRLVPAELAPSPRWRELGAWLDGDDPGVLQLAAGPGLGLERVGFNGARVLALLRGFPPGRDPSSNACLESFAYNWLGERAGPDCAIAGAQLLARRLMRRRLGQRIRSQDLSAASIHAWACLSATPDPDRSLLVGQMVRVCPQIEQRLIAIRHRVGWRGPSDSAQARRIARALNRAQLEAERGRP